MKRTKRNSLWRRADVRKMAGADIPMEVAIHLVSLRNLKKMEAPFQKRFLEEGENFYD